MIMKMLKNKSVFKWVAIALCATLLTIVSTGDVVYSADSHTFWENRTQAENYSKSKGIKAAGNGIGYINDGDYAEYDILFVDGGEATIYLIVSSASRGGKISFKIDGKSAGSVNVENTGGWRDYDAVSADLDIPEDGGSVTLRLEFSGGSGYLLDIDYFFVEHDDFANRSSNDGKIESESARFSSNGIVTENNGKTLGYIKNGYVSEYNLEVLSTGTCTFTARVASRSNGNDIEIFMDDEKVGVLDVPNTGQWQEYENASTEISIPHDMDNTMVDFKLKYVGSSRYLLNIDWLEIDC